MNSRSLIGLALAGLMFSSSAMGAASELATDTSAKAGRAAAGLPDPAPARATQGATENDGPAKEKRAAGGYSYSDKRPRSSGAARPRPARTGPSAAFPSFQASDGGGSRIVVHLSASVPVEERKAAGSVTYILKGVHVNRWNDTNPLVTVHFNTPVSQARLVPHGADLHLVVDLRAASAPTFKVSPGQAQGAGASLEIDFPKGDFTTPAPTTPAAPAAKTTPTPAPAPAPKTVPTPPAPSPAGPKP